MWHIGHCGTLAMWRAGNRIFGPTYYCLKKKINEEEVDTAQSPPPDIAHCRDGRHAHSGAITVPTITYSYYTVINRYSPRLKEKSPLAGARGGDGAC